MLQRKAKTTIIFFGKTGTVWEFVYTCSCFSLRSVPLGEGIPKISHKTADFFRTSLSPPLPASTDTYWGLFSKSAYYWRLAIFGEKARMLPLLGVLIFLSFHHSIIPAKSKKKEKGGSAICRKFPNNPIFFPDGFPIKNSHTI